MGFGLRPRGGVSQVQMESRERGQPPPGLEVSLTGIKGRCLEERVPSSGHIPAR